MRMQVASGVQAWIVLERRKHAPVNASPSYALTNGTGIVLFVSADARRSNVKNLLFGTTADVHALVLSSNNALGV